jgi:FixJ family two-component response regulator
MGGAHSLRPRPYRRFRLGAPDSERAVMTTREQSLTATRGTVADTLTIGVVEDDPSFLRALRRLLSGAGFSVATFASAEEFLASDSAATTACLVLDVHLGGMSGFDLQHHLVTLGIPIPTIFITAADDSATRARAQSGVAYLRKPFREDALIGAIHHALERPDA